MPIFVLTVLKVVFLALLYFFVYRAIRSVVLDAQGRPVGKRQAEGAAAGGAKVSKPSGRPKPPREAVITDERGQKVKTIHLDGRAPLQIGRAEACQIQVTDNYVSQFHARIFSRDGAWFIEDLGSTNGTYLNQRKVSSPAELQAGDRVKLGKTTVELRR